MLQSITRINLALILLSLCVLQSPSYAQGEDAYSEYDDSARRNRQYKREFGQTVKDASVLKRSRPEYDAVGGRYGGFIYYPYATAGLLFDDNVFSNTADNDDLILRTSAGLKSESDWGRHFLSSQFDIEDYRHQDFQSEDITNISSTTKGRLDIHHDMALHGLFSVTHSHETRGAGDAPLSSQAVSPTRFSVIKGAAFIDKTIGRVNLQLSGSIEQYDYDDVAAVGGGVLDQDSRDGEIYKVGLRKAYGFSPGYNVFGAVEANFRDFEGGGGSPNRDSDGIEARAGLEFEVTRLIAGELSAGYLHQDYENGALADVNDLALKAALIWNPTRLMTVSMEATRILAETTVSGASGHLDTLYSAKVDYEIRRNLIGSAHLKYLTEDYKGITREDDTVTTGITLEYLINRNLRANSYYTYTSRDSTNGALDYNKNVIGGAIKLQF